MSWRAECNIPPGEFEASGHHRINAMEPSGDDRAPRERNRQFEIAKEMVSQILESGAVGDAGVEGFHVVINGHANPTHEKPPGWAADSISIQIRQMANVSAALTR
jgi:hypothetical protein